MSWWGSHEVKYFFPLRGQHKLPCLMKPEGIGETPAETSMDVAMTDGTWKLMDS